MEPNGAGYIPHESVIDGLSKLWNLFSKESKAARAADLANKNATTADIQAVTGLRPEQMRLGWDEHNVQREGQQVQRDQIGENSRQFNLTLPLRQGELDVSRDQVKNQGRSIDEGVRQFDLGLPLRQAEVADAQKRTGFVGQQVEQQGRELDQRNKQFDASQVFANKKLTLDQGQDKLNALTHLFTSGGAFMKPNQQGAILNEIMAQFPEAAASLKRHDEEVRQRQQEVLKSLNGEESSSASAPVIDVNSPEIRSGGVVNWLRDLTFGTPEYQAQERVKWEQTEKATQEKYKSFLLGEKKPNPNYKPTPTQSPSPSGSSLFRGEGNATIFGHNLDGSPDREDNGKGAFGANTRDPNLAGVSLPIELMDHLFGNNLDAIRNARVSVENPRTHKKGLFPIVDKGPAKWTGNAIDLTGAAGRQLGSTGKDHMIYEILKTLQNQSK